MKILRAILSVATMILMSCSLLVAVPTTTHASVKPDITVIATAAHPLQVPEEYAYVMLGNQYPVKTANKTREINPVKFSIVKKGDSLTGIASSDRIAWQSLYCENKAEIGINPNFIKPGERLVIPEVTVKCKIEDGTTEVTKVVGGGGRGVGSRTGSPIGGGGSGIGQTLQSFAISLLNGNGTQFSCLNSVIMRESSWNVYAQNPGSGAYGIPQALPGSKMSVAGSDWATDGYTQLRWMIEFYIPPTYGTPCGAWQHELDYGWY